MKLSFWIQYYLVVISYEVIDIASCELQRFDGWYNNLDNPKWGSIGDNIIYTVRPAYNDLTYEPSGSARPNPRTISNNLLRGPSGLPSYQNRTVLFAYFGQMIAYEMIQSSDSGCPMELLKVPVPNDDPDFSGSTLSLFSQSQDGSSSSSKISDPGSSSQQFFPFVRSDYDKSTGHSPNRPRQPLNKVSSWIDGSFIYGPDEVWASSLRMFRNGMLAAHNVSGFYPAYNHIRLPLDSYPSSASDHIIDAEKLWVTGDKNTHQNPGLLVMHLVWFRYHNVVAQRLSVLHPEWTDNKLYHSARRHVIAVLQNIIMYEWLAGLLNQTVPQYSRYNRHIQPGIDVMFESAAFRSLHTAIPPGFYVRRRGCNFVDTDDGPAIRLCNAYWNSQALVEKYGTESLLLGMTSQIGEREDHVITDDIRGKLFGPLHYTRQDLALLSVMRGRDHGLPDYNTVRQGFGLPSVASWREINPWLTINNPQLVEAARETYNDSLDLMDPYIGGILEATPDSIGPLFTRVILDQFLRTRDGDRMWFENKENKLYTSDDEIEAIKRIRFKDVILDAMDIDEDELQDNVFFWRNGDPCPQPRQLMDHDLVPCNAHRNYDYFKGSEAAYSTAIVCLILLPFVCTGVGLLLVRIKNYRATHEQKRQKIQSSKNDQKQQSELYSSADNASCCVFQAMELTGNKAESSHPVELRLDTEKCLLTVRSRDEHDASGQSRDICLIDVAPQLMIWLSSDGKRNLFLLPCQADHDLILRFEDEARRSEFEAKIHGAMKSHNRSVERHEVDRKELLDKAVTKSRRKRLLADFFKSVLSEADNAAAFLNPDDVELNECRDVADCQLSRAEFAEALAMRPDSPFVNRMFELADRGGTGLISFRELLYIVALFSQGNSMAKLKLLFRITDKENKGALSRADITEMMKSIMELGNGRSDVEGLQRMVDDMIGRLGPSASEGQGRFIKFKDFCLLFSDHVDLFSDMSLDWKGISSFVPKDKRFKTNAISKSRTESQLNGGKQLVDSDRSAHSNGNHVHNGVKGKTMMVRNVSSPIIASTSADVLTQGARMNLEDSQEIRWTKRNDPLVQRNRWIRKNMSSMLKPIRRYVDNYRQHIVYLVIFYSACIIVFTERFYRYAVDMEDRGLRRMTGYGLSLTRGAAAAMSLTFPLLLLTMCRNFITLLRETFLNLYVPFDSHVAFHKIVAYTALVFTGLHVIGYCFNFYSIATQPVQYLCIFNEFHFRSDFLPKMHYWLFQTIPGFTGIFLVISICVIYIFASSYFRERIYNAFWMTHQLFYLFFLLALLHGTVRVVQDPFFPYYFIGPATLFAIDKLISLSRRSRELDVVRVVALPSGVTAIEMKRPSSFPYKSGQWIRLAVTHLGASEYHSLTLTSAPHEPILSVHVRAVGPWTRAVRKLTVHNQDLQIPRPLLKVYVDGPFGAGQQDWLKYDVSVMVGGGIGVTPYASILKDFVFRSSTLESFKIKCSKIYFIWVTADQKQFEWFIDILRSVEEVDKRGVVETHIFITKLFAHYDLRTVMLYMFEEHVRKSSSGQSLFTGIKARSHFGRPDFDMILRAIADKHSQVKKIGVFSCGPPGLTKGVEDACMTAGRLSATPRFLHHFENF